MRGTLDQAKGGKGGDQQLQETAAGAGMRRGAQISAAEADGCRVWATSRWAALCSWRVSGERVQQHVRGI